jgi:hypothetical protein
MAFFKLKTAAAALLLISVLAGSAIVSAQGPGPAPGALPSSNSDRFAVLEAKLDRLIQALEKGSVAANSAPRGDFDMAPQADGPRNYPADAPPPGLAFGPPPASRGYRPAGAQKGQKAGEGVNTATDYLPGGIPPRPSGLEQRVADVERRLAALERVIGASQSSHQPSGATKAGQQKK